MTDDDWERLGAPARVAAVARLLARLRLVHAFGHVSTRTSDGFLITPTDPPLGMADPGSILELGSDCGPLDDGAPERGRRIPLEAPMHAAIYRARADVGAICRIHGPATAAWAVRRDPPPLLHGFGGIVEPVAMWPEPDLVAHGMVAEGVARALGTAKAILLRGNGGLTVGRDLRQAAVRAWCLEDRCDIAERAGGAGTSLSSDEIARRQRWYDAEEARLWRWLLATYGD